jgi:hypothetical protein
MAGQWTPQATTLADIDVVQEFQNFTYTISYLAYPRYKPPLQCPVTITPSEAFSTVNISNGTFATISGHYEYVFTDNSITYKQTADDNSSSYVTVRQSDIKTSIFDHLVQNDIYAITSFRPDLTLYKYYYYTATAQDPDDGPVSQTYLIICTNYWDTGQAAFLQVLSGEREGK